MIAPAIAVTFIGGCVLVWTSVRVAGINRRMAWFTAIAAMFVFGCVAYGAFAAAALVCK